MDPDRSAAAYAPGTVGNVICGFDVFGLALEEPGDRVTIRASPEPGIRLTRILGDDGRLPTDPTRNSTTVAILEFLKLTGNELRSGDGDWGLDVEVEKGLPLSGGMGGSAASAAAGTVAIDALLETGASPEILLRAALAGEKVASGDEHLDNVAPALFGGLLLVRPSEIRPVVRLPVPEGLSVALLHPRVEMSTRAGRAAVGPTVPLRDAVAQWGDTAAFVAGLHSEDWELIADALVDRIAEPRRSASVPHFLDVRAAALETGAVGCGISGAGPAIFALCRSLELARAVGNAMLSAFNERSHLPATLHLSPIAARGARPVEALKEESR